MRTIQPVDEGPPPTTRLAGKGALPTIRLATILGLLATAALLGVVSATAGLGAAGWIVGLVTGSAAAALVVGARLRSDQPAIFPADWVTLTRTLVIAGVAGDEDSCHERFGSVRDSAPSRCSSRSAVTRP